MVQIPAPPNPTDHYRNILLRLFNRNRLNSENPDAAFFYSFTQESLEELFSTVPSVLRDLGRPSVIVNCSGKTNRQIYAEVAITLGWDVPDKADSCTASEAFEKALLGSASSLVLYMLSASKVTFKSGFARGCIKVLDDAHIHGARAMSDIIFIDRPSFLEKAWPDIGAYLRPIAPFDSWIEWMDNLDSDSGRPTLLPV